MSQPTHTPLRWEPDLGWRVAAEILAQLPTTAITVTHRGPSGRQASAPPVQAAPSAGSERSGPHPAERRRPHALADLPGPGACATVEHAQRHDARIADLCWRVGQRHSAQVSAALHLRGPGAPARLRDREDHDVLVLAARGLQRWRVFPPMDQAGDQPHVDASPTGIELLPGDELVLPRGWGHEATGGPSLHLTLALQRPTEPSDAATSGANPHGAAPGPAGRGSRLRWLPRARPTSAQASTGSHDPTGPALLEVLHRLADAGELPLTQLLALGLPEDRIAALIEAGLLGWSRGAGCPLARPASFEIRSLDPTSPGELDTLTHMCMQTLLETIPELGGDAARARSVLSNFDFDTMRAMIHADLPKDTHHFLVAVVQGQIVGHSMFSRKRDDRGRPYGMFFSRFVEPTHRGRGISSRLLAEALRWFSRFDLRYLETHTHVTNHRQRGLLEHHGFVVVAQTQQSWSSVTYRRDLTG